MSESIGHVELSAEFHEKYCHGKAPPLPGLKRHEANKDRYEVIIAGAGPAGLGSCSSYLFNRLTSATGLFLKLLLARYGLGDDAVLCVDPKNGPIDVGHADGLNARTIEILATLGLESEVLHDARDMVSDVEYKLSPEGLQKLHERQFYFAPARFAQYSNFHQGRVERMLLQDLRKYSKTGVNYTSAVSSVTLSEIDPEYPVQVEVQTGESTHVIGAKYIVGADGAHSLVRRTANIQMEGDTLDEIWGVVDFVPETDFDDIRKLVRITDPTGIRKMMVIPREKMSDGNWLVRVYVAMTESAKDNISTANDVREQVRRKKAGIEVTHIIKHIQDGFQPYKIDVKPGTKPVWWTVYSAGQRLAERFLVEDSTGHPRMILMGDACHTHSPSHGQGMNISTQDAYFLSWRLAYSVLGLCKDAKTLLKTYEADRRPWAEKVVFADKRWTQSAYSWKDLFEEMKGQVTGCGLEEVPSLLVSEKNDAVEWQGKDLLSGILRTGRRLFNVPIKRWADCTHLDIHDESASDGRYRILVLASTDFPQARSRSAIQQTCALISAYAPSLVSMVVLQPYDTGSGFGWAQLPVELKRLAEMSVHYADKKAYATYGVSQDKGAVALIRPDGIVSITAGLDDVRAVEEMLRRVLVGHYEADQDLGGKE